MHRFSWEAVLCVSICVYDTVNMHQGATEGQIQKSIDLVGKKKKNIVKVLYNYSCKDTNFDLRFLTE